MAVDNGGAPPPPPQGTPHSTAQRRTSMTANEQKERRASIQAIMKDQALTPSERRRSIQQLMDGRRRSSTASYGGGGGMAAAAAAAAAAFDDSASEFGDDASPNGIGIDGTDNSVDNSSVGGGSSSMGAASRRSSRNYGRSNSLRGSFTIGFSGMGFGGGSERRDSSASGSVDPSTGHHLGSAIGSSRKMEKSRPECNHYERKCTLISPCCGLAFGCRICHDDSPVLPPPIFLQKADEEGDEDLLIGNGHDDDAKSVGAQGGPAKPRRFDRSASLPTSFQEDETHHNIDRFLVKEVICRECYTRQSSKTNNCIKCNVQFGDYHCSICNLWMSSDEEPYHCPDCGFCRVGGRENFKHCHDCGMCIDALLFDDHNCKTGKYMSNCPVCQEDLFSSRSASHEMPCGHAIHWHCFRELTSFDTRCPVCKKTAETHEQMAPTWQAMAMGIALQPVPPDLARVVTIICNDCERTDADRRWHFLGVQCRACTSFNTTVESTQLVGHEAAAFLGDTDQPNADGDGGAAAHAALVGGMPPAAAAQVTAAAAGGGGGSGRTGEGTDGLSSTDHGAPMGFGARLRDELDYRQLGGLQQQHQQQRGGSGGIDDMEESMQNMDMDDIDPSLRRF